MPMALAEEGGAVLMDALGPFEEEQRSDRGEVTLVFYPSVGSPSATRDLLQLLPPAFAEPGVVRVEFRDVARDWVEGWREHFRPVLIGEVRIRPPWEPAPSSPDAPVIDVVINPGLGFGTGLHPTTRGTLLLLQQGSDETPGPAAARGSLVDVGTGSGILAIAAARLGWAPVIAVDNDPVAVASARENVALNLVEDHVEVYETDVAHLQGEWFRGATVLANMTLEPVSLLLRRLADEPACESEGPRRVVVSGILSGVQEERLVGVARECGLLPGRRVHDQGWVSVELLPNVPGS
jgi:ribosomal protein L11 methyltransferase